MKPRQDLKPQLWIAAIFAMGIGYLLFLQAQIPDGAYFSGDSGLKAMLSQSLAAGSPSFALPFSDQLWIKELWIEGMFPYQEPYVYHLDEKYYMTFPYTFSLASAPLYAAFGYRGLYLLPGLSTLVTWLLFYWICRKLDLSIAATAVGLALLIFASNLAIYSAMFSEHTLSVCLAFAGLALMIPARGARQVRFWAAGWAGLLAGLAVWLRPEQIFLVLFLGLLALWGLLKPGLLRLAARYPAARLPGDRHPGARHPDLSRLALEKLPDPTGRAGWAYLAASLLALLGYGLSNLLIYRNMFGIHALQVIEHQPLRDRLLGSLGNLTLMTAGRFSLFLYLPAALLVLAFTALAWTRPTLFSAARLWTAICAGCLAFVLGAALLVPPGAGGQQWGPRFLLLLAPLLLLLLSMQIDRFYHKHKPGSAGPVLRWAAAACILAVGLFGVVQNPWRGVKFLQETYTEIQPAVEVLRAQPAPVLAISNQFIGQVLQPALDPRTVVLKVTSLNHLARLSAALFNQQQAGFTYVCFLNTCPAFLLEENPLRVERGGLWYQVHTVRRGDYGKYTIFNLRIQRED